MMNVECSWLLVVIVSYSLYVMVNTHKTVQLDNKR